MGMQLQFLRVQASELEAYRADSQLLAEKLINQRQRDTTDIDKSWDGIIYLLTGKNSSDTTTPLSSLMFSNQLIDAQQDLGTGSAHYLFPEQVWTLNQQIKDTCARFFKSKF